MQNFPVGRVPITAFIAASMLGAATPAATAGRTNVTAVESCLFLVIASGLATEPGPAVQLQNPL
jgi:hypothetical protein